MRTLVVAATISLTLAACQATQRAGGDADCAKPDAINYVQAAGHCIGIQTYGAATGQPRAVIVYLHGDVSRGGGADYMVRHITSPPSGTVAIAMLRPGYSGYGKRSSGSTNGRRDHYTARNVDAVASALRRIKAHYKGTRLFVVGHSGGAAMTATIIGRHRGLIDTAILVSCPCDLVTWRQGRSPWTNSLNPAIYASRVPTATRVVAITGSADTNTQAFLAQAYVEKLKARGVPATVQIVDGAGHGYRGLAATVNTAVQTALGD